MICASLAVVYGPVQTPALKVCVVALTAVLFYPGSSGLVTTLIYEITELEKIGKYDPGRNEYGHIVRMICELTCAQSKVYLCTPSAQQRGLCKPEQLNLYIIDDEESTWSIKQERMDFGERLAETQVMARIFDSR